MKAGHMAICAALLLSPAANADFECRNYFGTVRCTETPSLVVPRIQVPQQQLDFQNLIPPRAPFRSGYDPIGSYQRALELQMLQQQIELQRQMLER